MSANLKDLLKLIKSPKKEDIALITKAYEFAKEAHKEQKRQNGDPYFYHVFETAKNLAIFGMDTKTIVAGLLHDTLEDTDVTEAKFKKEFGEEIAFLVKGVTKLGKVKYHGQERHVESLRKFFVAMAEDIRVILVKLADRLHNIQTIQYLPEEKRKRIALETIEIHAKLADRLGMGKLKGELEDYAFPYAYPKEYEQVTELLKNKINLNKKYLETVYKDLKKILYEQSIKVLKIDYREKHKYSLYKKLTRYGMDISRIYDIIALRVIVPTVEDCYRTLGIIHSAWKPLPGRIKDYIATPKPNGYQSLQTTVFSGNGEIVEIQIRTEQMHMEAEYGIASHFLYKENLDKKDGKTVSKKFEWINQLKDLQKIIADPVKFLENLKTDFFRDRIFIFTPHGDVVDLPEDSGPIDFAYAIHSRIGDHTSGAKVNGKLTALDAKLKNGDIVEIITKENAHPSSRWMEYTKTALAKRHIKAYLQKNSSGLLGKIFGPSKSK
ncbi:MAG: RelA/SpoT family protein [Candidatus Paceibacterota bacterium]|jgi:GTP pyrophosphokinase